MEQIDAKARDIVRAFREQLAGREILGQATLPPPPAELKELKKERDALVPAAIGKLKASLGTDAATRLDSMLQPSSRSKRSHKPHLLRLRRIIPT